MPLILISGFPSSGKSSRGAQLEKFLEGKGKKVHLISENIAIKRAGITKNMCFSNFQLEKQVRSDMKSEILRLLNKEDVIIFDACNNIKGFRYELYCATKSTRTTQLTLFCCIQREKAWIFNINRACDSSSNCEDPYTKDVFEALCDRFEEPNGNFRWDSPLFVAFPEDELEYDKIFEALFESKSLPPNQSTQNAPLSSANYLFDLDRVTQSIINDILASQKIGIVGNLKLKDSLTTVNIPENTSAAHLNRLRKQFINYSKIHSSNTSISRVPQLFAQYLNTNLKE